MPVPLLALPREKHGFTLTELLASLAILAVLITVAMVGLGPAIQYSREGRCVHNLRQLHQAITMYASDHGGLAPFGLEKDKDGATVSYLGIASNSKFKNYIPTTSGNGYAEPYLCPSDGIREPKKGLGRGYFGHSYGANSMLCQENNNRVSNWLNPSQTLLMADGTTTIIYHSNPGSSFSSRHRGGANIMFLDGHVEWRKAPWPLRSENRFFWDPPYRGEG